MAGNDDIPELDDSDDYPQEDILDREMPSVSGGATNGQLALGAIFLILALIAIFYVLKADKKTTPKMTDAEETPFVVNRPNAPKAPVLPPQRTKPPVSVQSPRPSGRANYDPAKARREALLAQARLDAATRAQKRLDERRTSPQLVLGGGSSAVSNVLGTNSSNSNLSSLQQELFNAQNNPRGSQGGLTGFGGAKPKDNDANAQFFDAVKNDKVPSSKAVQLQNLHDLIPQGTIIKGILETAIQSDLPGMIRAVATEDTYSFDATKNLIPRGSRLIGRYNSSIENGQTRIFVIWERVIRPDGISIKIDSPGTDPLGVAGLGGDVDNHFFKRFGSAILLSLIDGGIQAGVQSLNKNNSTTIAIGNAGDSTRRIADRALEQNIDIPPTIYVDQGTRLNIFVAKDLEFGM